jgi:hypothetical protein
MQRIDILGAEEEPVTERAFQFRQGKVRGIRLDRLVPLPALRVKLPNHFWISRKCLRSRNVLHPISPPESVGATKRRQPTLRAHSGAGEPEHAILGRKPSHAVVSLPLAFSNPPPVSIY